MSNLKKLLQDTDPLRHEPAHLDLQRERLRQTMLRAARAQGETTPMRIRARFAAAAAVVAIVFGVGYSAWVTQVSAAVRFEVRLAEDQPRAGLVVAQVGADPVHLIYLHPRPVVANDDIAQSWVVDDGSEQYAVSVELLQPGADRMRQATSAHTGRPMAVLIDGRVVMAPVVRSEIGASAVITGDFSRAEAERVADGISRH